MTEGQRNPSGDVDVGMCLMEVVHSFEYHGHDESVSHLYVRYVAQKYGAAAIVFDGYTDYPTTKDATHLRRPGDCLWVPVHFSFLNNKANKQRFIHYLSDNLDTIER